MGSQYYIQREGQETGPFGFRDLIAFVREGKLNDGELVRFSWTKNWQRADSLVGLFHMARRSPEEVAGFDEADVSVISVERNPVTQEVDLSTPAVDDRPGWMLRLLQVGGFRRTKASEIPMLGPPPTADSEILAQGASTVGIQPLEDPSVVSGAEPSSSSVPARLPHENLPAEIAGYFNREAATESDRWSSAVDEALAAVKVSGAGKSAKSRTSRFQKLLGGLSRFVPRGGLRQSLERIGFRFGCTIVSANLVAWWVATWSAQESLQFPSAEAQPSSLRYFPVFGTCSTGEYLFLLFDLMLATALVAWFAAGWIESRTE